MRVGIFYHLGKNHFDDKTLEELSDRLKLDALITALADNQMEHRQYPYLDVEEHLTPGFKLESDESK